MLSRLDFKICYLASNVSETTFEKKKHLRAILKPPYALSKALKITTQMISETSLDYNIAARIADEKCSMCIEILSFFLQ